jgi:predicted nucleic acid-binding protein
VRVVLIDTGPIVAFLNRRDRHHAWAEEALAAVRPPLVTCEAVLSEATYLLRGIVGGPDRALELVTRGLIVPSFRLEQESASVRALMSRYSGVAMDLADACLVRLSELHPDCLLMTVDAEFRDIFRRRGRQAIPTLLPTPVRRRPR